MTMATVAIGIYLDQAVQRLAATLTAVTGSVGHRRELLLLPDGADRPTRTALTQLALPQSGTAEPLGPPACFNRLAAETDSDVVILLESGCVPAPGAIDALVDALLSDRRIGLAGPSTNLAWNQQAVFPRALGSAAEVERTGRAAATRFGRAVRPLTPLHSLSDFCYAVRRDVIETIGGADEGYGLGPCWEMEYNARAARAGFEGVWVCGAYVYRAPFTARRRVEEQRRFDASRRRYQDSVCGLRLRGARTHYEPHCRGELCEHFAPAGLIQIRRPLPDSRAGAAPGPSTRAPATGAPVPRQLEMRWPATPRSSALPLVSCVMPTGNRAAFALQAVKLFQRQDYEPRELIVVDDGHDQLREQLPDDSRIRYLRSPVGESIGAKRNRACGAAAGAFIAQWDDDDWYGPRRLLVQLEPLLTGRAELSGLRTPVFFELDRWRFWSVSDALHRRLFVEDVHGGTLVFSRSVWERLARYPHVSLAEDAAFLARAKAAGARLEQVPGEGLFVYLRHGSNAWRFPCGSYLDQRGWSPTLEPALDAEDRAFYAAHSANAPPAPGRPFVSCIMPTANRRWFAQRAIAYFMRQDYSDRELLVLDDGEDRVEDLIPGDARVRYVALDQRLVLGAKRNRACELARGEVIVHWDDDDWQAPARVSYQVGELARHGAELCGPSRALYFDPRVGRAWQYEYAGHPTWVAGNALCYRREAWERRRFAEVAIGEDNSFVWGMRGVPPLVHADHRFLVALVHAANASPKVTGGTCWQPRQLDEVRTLLGSDWADYAQLSTSVCR
jgi:O-antigen biosynthesis protein